MPNWWASSGAFSAGFALSTVGAGGERAVERDRVVGAVAGHDRDHVAAADAVLGEPGGEPADAVGELAERERAAAARVDDRRSAPRGAQPTAGSSSSTSLRLRFEGWVPRQIMGRPYARSAAPVVTNVM